MKGIAGISALLIIISLMGFVANVAPYESKGYNCFQHSILLTYLLRENEIEAHYKAGYVNWNRYESQEEIDKLNTTNNISIGDYKCCHAWVEVELWGQNFTIESTNGRFVNASEYISRESIGQWDWNSTLLKEEADGIMMKVGLI